MREKVRGGRGSGRGRERERGIGVCVYERESRGWERVGGWGGEREIVGSGRGRMAVYVRDLKSRGWERREGERGRVSRRWERESERERVKDGRGERECVGDVRGERV